MRTCSVEGCGQDHAARGWCSTHLSRWRRTGTTDLTRVLSDKPEAAKQRERRKARPSSSAWAGEPEPCPTCGKEFTPTRDRFVACSMSCAQLARLGKKEATPKACKVWFPTCTQCHRVFTSKVSRSYLCSAECRKRATWKVVATKVCTLCGSSFTPPVGNAKPRLCSDACRDQMDKASRDKVRARRRVRMRKPQGSALVVRKQIYERDGWRCHICTKPVRRDAVVPHPQAPTIDHLIPLAEGGTHEPHNVRTAHFICNSKRGAGGVVQLLLVA